MLGVYTGRTYNDADVFGQVWGDLTGEDQLPGPEPGWNAEPGNAK